MRSLSNFLFDGIKKLSANFKHVLLFDDVSITKSLVSAPTEQQQRGFPHLLGGGGGGGGYRCCEVY